MGIAPSRKALEHDLQEPEFLVGTSNDSPRAHETLKHDDAFAVLDTHGDIGVFGNGADGLFYKDTRYLSHLELLMARSATLLLGSTLDGGSLQLCSDLTNPDVFAEGRLWLHKDAVHIYRTSYVRDGAIRQRLMFTNHSSSDLELAVSLIFDCDFADIFEARGMRREKRGSLE